MPSFVARVERPDRGGEWVALPRARAARRPSAGPRGSGSTATPSAEDAARPCGCCTSTATRSGCSPRCCSRPPASREERTLRARSRALGAEERARAAAPTSSASARNRRHRPGRGFEALRYRFEIVSDYGAFRDLQRHRMLTVPVAGADARPRRRRARRRSPRPAAATPTARALERSRGGVRAARRRRPARRGAVRALPRLPHPLRARPQRARGDAPDRAALRPRGPSRATAPSRTRCTRRSPTRHPAVAAAMTHVDRERRAAARAHPLRDAASTAARR